MINLCKQMNYAKYKSEQYEDFKSSYRNWLPREVSDFNF